MILLKNPEQIAGMRKAGALLYEVLQTLKEEVKPGITTQDLNLRAEELIRKGNAVPSFLNYDGFPASLCTSINEVVVHGIPSDQDVLKEGDILSLDCGLILEGWQADSALTVPVGKVSAEAEKLIAITEQCFFAGAHEARVGNTLGDIGAAVQHVAESNGYGVVRDLTGHGIGRDMHEDPSVYNFGIQKITADSGAKVDIEDDGWFVRTCDRKLSSHYEHTVAIVDDQPPELLTYPGFVWKEEN